MPDNVDALYVPPSAEPVVKVLVVDGDPSCAQSLDLALRSRSRRRDDLPYQVTAVYDSTEALARLALGGWDVLVTDMQIPGLDGLALIDAARVLIPNLGIVLVTGRATVDTTVTALRDGIQDVLVTPTTPTEVAESVTRVVRGLRRAATVGQHRVLAIGAHPDDVEIGVGGTLLAHQAAGIEIVVLTLSRGAVGGTTEQRARESQHAAEMLGARLFHLDLPDTMISAGPPTVPAIEAVVAEVRPTTVYVHSGNDQHQDHHATFRAATVACRQVPRLYCYQSPSSSLNFHPNRFVPIDDWFEAKIGVLRCYQSQMALRAYLDPELIRATARYWGFHGRTRFAEPLEVVRDVAGSSLAGQEPPALAARPPHVPSQRNGPGQLAAASAEVPGVPAR